MSKTERISFIHSSIKRYGRVTMSEIINEFEVNERTVRRDFEELRLMHDAPLIYNRDKKFYYYDDEFKNLDFFDDKMLLYYTLINSITSSSSYIPIVADEFKEYIEDKLSNKYIKIADKVSFQISEIENVKIEYFFKIFQSMIESKSLLVEYTNLQNKTTQREITPQRLINYSGAWYLFAYDVNINQLRNFNLSRFESINFGDEITDFEIDNEQIELSINGTFGIYKGEKREKIVIKFYDEVANLVKNQTWEKEQESVFDEATNTLTLTLNIVDEREIIGKVLRYGSRAEIVSPQNIRDMWIGEIKSLSERFL